VPHDPSLRHRVTPLWLCWRVPERSAGRQRVRVKRNSARDGDRAQRGIGDLLRHAAEQKSGEPAAPATADNDEVGLGSLLKAQDFLGCIAKKDLASNGA